MPGVHAESLSNHNLSTALRYLNKTKPIRIVIFGQSLGGNATVELARALKARHVPVLLTVQIDSVGLRDAVIPGNVRKAVNYFQHDPLTIWGRSSIRAEDPSQTTILGNFERRYPLFEPVQTSWARRYLGGGHARMEADRALWQEVEDLIRSEIIRR
jgi:pimeloyl-ACP methyl ester carboxylesterase